MRRAAALVLSALAMAALVAMGVAATSRMPAVAEGEARLLLDAGDRVRGRSHGDVVARGSRVEAVAGEPELLLSRGRRVALRADTVVTVGAAVGLESGDVLVTTGGQGPAQIDAGIARFTTRGTVRVTRGLDAAVRVYDGEAIASSAQQSVSVARLQQVSVPALGLVPRTAAWVTWEPGDAWDSRHLGTVIDVTDALDTASRGFALQAGDAAAGETLVATAVARVAPGLALGEVRALRVAGAAWGVVTAARTSGRGPDAVRAVYEAIERWARERAASSQALVGPGAVASSSTAPETPGALPPGPTAPATGAATEAPPVDPQPSPPASAPPVTTPVVPVPVPSTPVPTTAPGVVGEVVGGLVDRVGGGAPLP